MSSKGWLIGECSCEIPSSDICREALSRTGRKFLGLVGLTASAVEAEWSVPSILDVGWGLEREWGVLACELIWEEGDLRSSWRMKEINSREECSSSIDRTASHLISSPSTKSSKLGSCHWWAFSSESWRKACRRLWMGAYLDIQYICRAYQWQ